MNEHDHSHAAPPELTRNQALVYGELSGSQNPLSAYTLLDRLRDRGMRAPLQVYRALDKLVDFGMVHRLESLNAFVACRHPDCETHRAVSFTICEKCGKVAEYADAGLTRHLEALARQSGFRLRQSTVELRGDCRECRDA